MAVITTTFVGQDPVQYNNISVTILPEVISITTAYVGQEPMFYAGLGTGSVGIFGGADIIFTGSFNPIILPQTSNGPVTTRYFLG